MSATPFVLPTTRLDRRTLGKYEVLCRLSTGGMSEIFLAHQKGLAGFRKIVVLKSILPDIRGEEEFVEMFLDEAKTTAAFNHPNIAQVFDLDVDDGVLFLAMEFVPGCTLVEMARACRQAKEAIPIGLTLSAVRDTALALHYAHTFTDARGRKQVVIHRDVAEKNIMVTYDGTNKLLDFGIAKALGIARQARTSVGMVKGTSGYMSPEQIRGEPLDPRSDLFSLGVVLHECLTGMRLFHGKSAEDSMMAALKEDAAPPSKQNPAISPELDAVVMKALKRAKEDRYATSLEFARALEKAGAGLFWHPEQSAELVQRFFKERRQQTQILLDEAHEQHESTGQIQIGKLLSQLSQPPSLGGKTLKPEPPKTAPVTSPPTLVPKKPAVSAPTTVPPARKDTAAALQTISTGPAERTDTSDPGRQPKSKTPIKPLTVKLDGGLSVSKVNAPTGFEDDEPGAKTMPASFLPDNVLPPSVRPQPPPTTSTGFDDDDPGARTKIGNLEDDLQTAAPKPMTLSNAMEPVTGPAATIDNDNPTTSERRPLGPMLYIAIAVVVLLVSVGLAAALGLGPFKEDAPKPPADEVKTVATPKPAPEPIKEPAPAPKDTVAPVVDSGTAQAVETTTVPVPVPVVDAGVVRVASPPPKAPPVRLPPKGPPAVTAPVQPPPPKVVAEGLLTLSSEPSNARVYVDGKDVGFTPLIKFKVAEGQRSIKLVAPNGKNITFKVKITENAEVSLFRSLEEEE